ncbi:PREDICTED: uncharacterized protein LOC101292730 [Fragaria vesca subsp. vesca]|uniref:uncharacterized protein LOC101292730 n=1 Tax=Fragaria vesca subsp. vesca TaxID=101020 RepID=UPI0002C3194C|nr:PREDICTED: uncharacterized protein LOC101292730 [Fragaria vesca subsp. vesca]
MEGMSYSTLRELGCGGSFSFSCSDSDLNFSSALSHFTDDVGDDVVEADDSSDVDDEESYIEIALDHHHHHPKATHEDCDGDRSDHVDYLRISFSSTFPFPDFSNHTNPNTQDDTNIVSDTTTDPAAVVTQAAASSSSTPISASSSTSLEDFGGSNHDVRTKRSKLPAVNRIVNTLFFSLWSSSDTTAKKASGAEEHYSIRHRQSQVDNGDFVQSRKVSNMKTTVNGGIMKLIFKFRAMNLGTLVASFVKPRKVVCPPDQEYCHFSYGVRKKKKSKAQSTLQHQKPLDKFFVQKEQQKKQVKMDTSREVGGGGEKSRVLEKNLNAFRGVLEAIGSSMSTGVNRKERRTRSCPSSIKSSPIHKEFAGGDQSKIFARETSIQAAIAHCKFSLE